MTRFLQFVVLGVGVGALYALFAQGLVVIYRGSGLVNFAQGAVGTLAAYVTFVTLYQDQRQVLWLSVAGGLVVATLATTLFQVLILARLRHAAPIVRLISTLGLLAVLQGLVEIFYEPGNTPVEPFLTQEGFTVGGVRVEYQRVILLAIAVAVTAALWAFSRWTRTGLAITAAAHNELAAQSLGWSPNRLATIAWAVGGGLAGFGMILAAPLTGLNPLTFTVAVTVAALAAALLGGFQSFPLTLVGGLVVGIGETLATSYKGDIEDLLHLGTLTGLQRAVPFLVILIVLVVRGRGLPVRSHVADRLPRLGSGSVRPLPLVVATVVGLAVVLLLFDAGWAAAASVSLTAGVIVLSIVVLAGYTGQVSLAQWAIGGVGALIAARLVQADWPLELAFVAAVVLTIPVGLVVALPALRTRGVNLTVLTLGLGFTLSQVVLANPEWTNGTTEAGTQVGPARLFGVAVDSARHPERWAAVCLLGLVATGLVVANLRRSRTGQRLLAVRTNERAAASLGVSVFAVKIYAFGVAAALAAVAGLLLGFRGSVVTYEQFNVFASIQAVGNAVIGGLGYVIGVVFAGPLTQGGLGTELFASVPQLDQAAGLLGGLLLWAAVLVHQHGLADVVVERWNARRGRPRRPGSGTELLAPPSEEDLRVAPAELAVRDLTVRFGAMTAVDGVSLRVGPGEIVGLIGPNGAGKTTFIDAVTGFVRPSSGTIHHGDRAVHGSSASSRARHGLRRSWQSLELFDDLTVAQNLQAGTETPSWWTWLTDLVHPGRHPLSGTARAAVQVFDLADVLDRTPEELSYGRRRLVGIARSVASNPATVLLDEPAAGLDDEESRELAALIRLLAQERGTGVLLVEHDVELVMATCDRVVVMDHGRVIADGTPGEVRAHPEVRSAYLGEELVALPEGVA